MKLVAPILAFTAATLAFPIENEYTPNNLIVVVDLNLSRDFEGVTDSIQPVLYELIDPTEDDLAALNSYKESVESKDLASGILSVFQLAAMKTQKDELFEDVSQDKEYYSKFVTDDLVEQVIKSNEENDVNKGFQNELFELFLNTDAESAIEIN